MKSYIERTLFTEEQSLIIANNKEFNGILLTMREADMNTPNFRVYLSYQQAIDLAEEIIEFTKKNQL